MFRKEFLERIVWIVSIELMLFSQLLLGSLCLVGWEKLGLLPREGIYQLSKDCQVIFRKYSGRSGLLMLMQ